MNKNTICCRIKPYIQPFERELALAELSTLAKATPSPINGSGEFSVRTETPIAALVDRLSYWEVVGDKAPRFTTQALHEATVNVARNRISFPQLRSSLPFVGDIPLPNRRCLRYGPHGIHEYRGKFFPQLVRALINKAGVHTRAVVADTMCGSGTTPVEAKLLGCTAIGLDMNPLSVYMARTKCDLLDVDAGLVMKAYGAVRAKLLDRRGKKNGREWLRSLPEADGRYLEKWFAAGVLDDLERVVAAIEGIATDTIRNYFRLALSNILRRISWQKEDDLRVRREVRRDVDIDPVSEFLEELDRSVRMVVALLLQTKGYCLGRSTILEGDARHSAATFARFRDRVDVVVTSPPYATALPYLDTDRLSLIYLKLLSRPEHRRRDHEMIGNREITDRTRHHLWDCYLAHRDELPMGITRLIDRVERLNANSYAGFRRRNLSSLLAKYFLDMGPVFAQLRALLRRGAPAYVVVGNNHTYAGGERIEIETARLLAKLAERHGFQCDEMIPMEMLVSRDIFKKNAVASETIVCLKKR